jgi:hypothetical protein
VTFGDLMGILSFEGTYPLGCPKVLLEFHEESIFKIIPLNSHEIYDFNKLVPFLFKAGLPMILSSNLTKQEIIKFEESGSDKKNLLSMIHEYFLTKPSKLLF